LVFKGSCPVFNDLVDKVLQAEKKQDTGFSGQQPAAERIGIKEIFKKNKIG
jgi:hypothetical protein